MANIERDVLLGLNRGIEALLLKVAADLKKRGDRRWFFTYAHGRITKKINDNINRFRAPVELLRLNIDFATSFLDAINADGAGQSVPEHWKNAFDFCGGWAAVRGAKILWRRRNIFKDLADGDKDALGTVMPTVACGQAMAESHIKVDIPTSLRKTGCKVSDYDFGAMMLYVQEGGEDALRELYGEDAAKILEGGRALYPKLENQWRKAAYEGACGGEVPDVPIEFYAPDTRGPQ